MESVSSSWESGLVLVARLSLAAFFLPSALGKIRHSRAFLQGTIDYQILPVWGARLFAAILPWIELALAVALVIGIAQPLAGIVAALLLSCFVAAVVINLRRGREIKCNCYGIAGTRTIGWGTVVRNLLLLLLAAVQVAFTIRADPVDQWFGAWSSNEVLGLSFESISLLLLLVAFCVVTIFLLEWTIDLHYRVALLKSSQR